MKNKHFLGSILAIMSAIFYGGMAYFVKLAKANGTTTDTILLGRFLIAVLVLFAVTKISKISLKISWKQFILIFSLAVIGMVTTTYGLFHSYSYISVSKATSLHFVYPVVIAILATIMKQDKFSRNKILPIILCLIGVQLMMRSSVSGRGSIVGELFAVGSGVTYAIFATGLSLPLVKQVNSLVISFYTCLAGTISLLLVGGLKGTLEIETNPVSILSIFILALFSTVLSQVFFIKAVSLIGAFKSSILSTFEPLVGVTLGIVVFSEKVTLSIGLGIIATLLAVIIVVLQKGKVEIISEEIKQVA